MRRFRHRAALLGGLLAGLAPVAAPSAEAQRAMALSDGTVCAVDDRVACWHGSGRLRWQALAGEQVLALTAGDPLLAAGSHGVTALDPASGAVRWRHTGARAFPPITHAGRAWFGTHGGTLWCLAIATGRPCWQRELSSEWVYTPARLGATLVAVERHRTAWGLDADTGTLRWSRALPQEPVGPPTALSPGTALIATYDGTLRALDARNGEWQWAYDAGTAAAQWSARGETVVVRLLGGTLLALDARTGHRLWRRDLPGARHLAVHGNRAWVAVSNRVQAFALRTGQPVANHRLPAIAASPVTADGRILLHARAPRLHRLHRTGDASTTSNNPQ